MKYFNIALPKKLCQNDGNVYQLDKVHIGGAVAKTLTKFF